MAPAAGALAAATAAASPLSRNAGGNQALSRNE